MVVSKKKTNSLQKKILRRTTLSQRNQDSFRYMTQGSQTTLINQDPFNIKEALREALRELNNQALVQFEC